MMRLRGWVVSFRIGIGVWGSGLYGIVKPLPAIVIVARGISVAKFVHLVHVYFKLVCQVGEVLSRRTWPLPRLIAAGESAGTQGHANSRTKHTHTHMQTYYT
eukprot:1160464-Pelagomonas_calceolata.AAC.13